VGSVGKTNRGDTTKLSIRLTAAAMERIEKVATNLNLSKAGVILFSLANTLDKFPERYEVLNLESKYQLEPGNFTLTINKDLQERLNTIHKDYDINKNVLFGLVISDYFENQVEEILMQEPKSQEDIEPKPLAISVNNELKKKIDEYSDKYYIPLSGLVSFCILNGSMNSFPEYSSNESERVLTRIPAYLMRLVKEESKRLHVREGFYVELCLYKAFLSEERVFRL
jgi:hypothetical protein